MACFVSLIPLIISTTSISGFGAAPHLNVITHLRHLAVHTRYPTGFTDGFLSLWITDLGLSTNNEITMYNLLKPIIYAVSLAYPA